MKKLVLSGLSLLLLAAVVSCGTDEEGARSLIRQVAYSSGFLTNIRTYTARGAFRSKDNCVHWVKVGDQERIEIYGEACPANNALLDEKKAIVKLSIRKQGNTTQLMSGDKSFGLIDASNQLAELCDVVTGKVHACKATLKLTADGLGEVFDTIK